MVRAAAALEAAKRARVRVGGATAGEAMVGVTEKLKEEAARAAAIERAKAAAARVGARLEAAVARVRAEGGGRELQGGDGAGGGEGSDREGGSSEGEGAHAVLCSRGVGEGGGEAGGCEGFGRRR